MGLYLRHQNIERSNNLRQRSSITISRKGQEITSRNSRTNLSHTLANHTAQTTKVHTTKIIKLQQIASNQVW